MNQKLTDHEKSVLKEWNAKFGGYVSTHEDPEVEAFILEALNQERLRTLADCEGAVLKECPLEANNRCEDWTCWHRASADRIRNLKPKDS